MKERLTQQSSSRGFSVLGTASILCKVLALIYLPIQTAIVGDLGNGIFSTGYRLYMLIYSLSNVGLPIVISKFVSEQIAHGDYKGTRKILRSAFTILLSLGILSTLITFFGAGFFADIYNQKRATLMLMTIAPAFLFTAVSCGLRGYYQGRQNMLPTAFSQIIEQVLNTIFTVVFVYMMFNIGKAKSADAIAYAAAGSSLGTVIGAMAAAFFLLYLFFVVFKKQRHSEYKHQLYSGPELETKYIYLQMLKYAVPAIISTIAACAIDQIDNITFTRLLEQGANYTHDQANSMYGIYSYQYQRLFTLAIAFTTPLVTAMIPAISSAFSVDNLKLFKHRVHDNYKLIYIIMLPCIAGLTFLAKPIITVVFVHNNSGEGLVILGTWTAIFMAISYIQSGILIAIGKPIIAPVNTIIGMAAKVLCNLVLIPIHSVNIYGAIIGNAVAWIIAIILNQIFINRSINGTVHSARLLLLPASFSMIMGICCLLIYKLIYFLLALIHKGVIANDIAVVTAVLVGIVIYFTLMIKVGGTKAEEISRLPMGSKILRLLRKLPFLQSNLQKEAA